MKNNNSLYELLQILNRSDLNVNNNTMARLIVAALPKESSRNNKHTTHLHTTKTRRLIKAVFLLLSIQDLKIFYVRDIYGNTFSELKPMYASGFFHTLEVQLIHYINNNDSALLNQNVINKAIQGPEWVVVSIYKGILWASQKKTTNIKKIGYPNFLIDEQTEGLLDNTRNDYLKSIIEWSVSNKSTSITPLLNKIKIPNLFNK